jgi:HipA-like protein
MRSAIVQYKGTTAGVLTQSDDGSFTFRYQDQWLSDNDAPPISLTLQKSKQEHFSKNLFPFFYHMLPEGANRQAVCHLKRIDAQDDFGILLTTANFDTAGAVTIKKLEEVA